MKDHEDRHNQIRGIDGTPGADGSVTTKRLFGNACRGRRRLVGGARLFLSGAGGPLPDFSFATPFVDSAYRGRTVYRKAFTRAVITIKTSCKLAPVKTSRQEQERERERRGLRVSAIEINARE